MIRIDKEQVFLQLEPKIDAKPGQILRILDVASVFCQDSNLTEEIQKIKILKVPDNQKSKVIFVLDIIKLIQENQNNVDMVVFGNPEILVDINVNKDYIGILIFFKIMIICIVLAIGAGLAIINFHEDVSMVESHRLVYYLVTGERVERPLILQIPYSLGIGIGMSVFFNHVFKKKWKKEPSPLEVEMYMYGKNMDDYILDKTKHNDH